MKRFSFFFFFFALFSAYSLAVDAQHVAFGDMPEDALVPTGKVVSVEADEIALAALSGHAGRTDNPHGVTAAQVGALPVGFQGTGTVARASVVGSGGTWVAATNGTATLNYPGRETGVYGGGDQIIVSGAAGEGYTGPEARTIFEFSDYADPVATFTAGVWRIQINSSVASVYLDREPERRTWYAAGTIPAPGYLDVLPDEFDEAAIGTVSLSWYGVGTVSEQLVTTPALQEVAGAIDGLLSEEVDPHALHETGGEMSGPLVLHGASGITWQGVGIETNFTVRVEYDGTNLNFNVYEVAR